MIKKLKLLIVVSLLLSAHYVMGQDWLVPDVDLNKTNQIEYNLDNVKAGKVLYLKNCKSCHGDPGKNNPLPLVPAPIDIASEKMHENTEGGIFYKIFKGRGVMPQFELTMSESEVWSIVCFILNYKPGTEPLLVELPAVKAKILASLNEDESIVNVVAEFEDKSGDFSKLINTPVIISLEKAFGNLEIGQAATDDDGNAVFVVPETIIRDKEGLMTLIVSLNEDFEAKEVVLRGAIIGTPKDVEQLIEEGVLYSTNDNIPLWLRLTYFGGVAGIWLVIGYVVFQIIKIRKYSKY